jgi:hypothetical protein
VKPALPARLALPVGLLLALFFLGLLRTSWRGTEEVAASDRALESRQPDLALRHAERAAILYVPGSASVAAAYARLRGLALGAEQRGDRAVAERAWGAIRSAALQSRHVWQPHSEELRDAESHLAHLVSAPPGGDPPGLAWVTADGSELPGPFGVAALCAGFAVAASSLIWLVGAALSPAGVFDWRAARAPLFGVCAGILALGGALSWG